MAEEKMQKDYSETCDSQLPAIEKLAETGSTAEALEKILVLEKQTRVAADLASNRRVLITAMEICRRSNDWKLLNEHVVLLSKKHGLLKQAVTSMVQKAMTYIDETPSDTIKLELIDTLRAVTEGKIFVEVERARLTQTLAAIKEKEGNIVEAADILQDVHVETFGSMDKREKTTFILEQMRLCLAKKDFPRVQVISRKISTKLFQNLEFSDLKIRFYELMIKYALHEGQYLDACKYYRNIYQTPEIQDNEEKRLETLRFVIFFATLAPYNNEQADLLHRINDDSFLVKIPLYREFIKCFITNELMRWPKMEEIYGPLWRESFVFDTKTEDGQKRFKELHKRVIEHNIRVVAKYYTRITVKRLTQLLDLNVSETEEFLSNLVVSKTIWARMDRPAGVVTFQHRKDPNTVLNDWSTNINSLLDLYVCEKRESNSSFTNFRCRIVKTTHLITKEEMVNNNGITQVI
ncbi:PCI domain-containing protein [Phlyctochytrium arcticum]|nr:PCI domain-containing protein [Phlyctochytrium arcticum]